MLGLAASYRGTMQPAISKVPNRIFYDEIVAHLGSQIADCSLSAIENYFLNFELYNFIDSNDFSNA